MCGTLKCNPELEYCRSSIPGTGGAPGYSCPSLAEACSRPRSNPNGSVQVWAAGVPLIARSSGTARDRIAQGTTGLPQKTEAESS